MAATLSPDAAGLRARKRTVNSGRTRLSGAALAVLRRRLGSRSQPDAMARNQNAKEKGLALLGSPGSGGRRKMFPRQAAQAFQGLYAYYPMPESSRCGPFLFFYGPGVAAVSCSGPGRWFDGVVADRRRGREVVFVPRHDLHSQATESAGNTPAEGSMDAWRDWSRRRKPLEMDAPWRSRPEKSILAGWSSAASPINLYYSIRMP